MEELPLTELTAVSPIDGRYGSRTKELRAYFSEYALQRYRTKIEVEYLIALSEWHLVRGLNDVERDMLRDKYSSFSLATGEAIKGHEKITNHDVKAVEYEIKERLKGSNLEDLLEMVHFGLTSYDINDNALYLMIKEGMESVYVPKLIELEKRLVDFAKQYRELPMLARTHGQPASPTTLGKEFSVFAYRLAKEICQLQDFKYPGKLNCATGNYNALQAAFPLVSWPDFSEDFLGNLGLEPSLITTQIEPHDKLVEWFQLMTRINNIVTDFDQDVWRYISDDWIVQKPKKEEVGSSTMPHKINPIDFENSEGNVVVANGLFSAFVSRLQQSRLQRDLVDSTITRNVGVAVAHSLLAVKSTIGGLGKISANEQEIEKALSEHPEILSEAYQTILRREGVEMPYERLKELTRGKKVSLADMHTFIDTLDIPYSVKTELKRILPENYIGIAPGLVDIALTDIDALIKK